MSLRTIMIFPECDNIAIINEIRKEYDPLAGLVQSHITIVFPFEDNMSNDELNSILDERLINIKPFDLVLKGFSKCVDSFGNYLFLNVIFGRGDIQVIYDILYKGEFSKYDLGLQYVPHMTVGKLGVVSELNLAFDKVCKINTEFRTMVNKISVEMIGKNEESIIVVEKNLA